MHPLERWMQTQSWTPWPFQREAWEAHARGDSGLIHVATGAGKTYAAFGGPLAELAAGPIAGLRVIYVTPLKALVRDIEAALRAPLQSVERKVEVGSLTGDTANKQRSQWRKQLPTVLVTTPESLALLIARSDARQSLAQLSTIIVDEWHELLGSKRGTLLQLTLTRLRAIAPTVKTWGISATLSDPSTAAEMLMPVGIRPTLVRGAMPRRVHVETLLPPAVDGFPWAGHLGLKMLPALLAKLDVDVSHLIFTNTRSQAERWFQALREARPAWSERMALHHGSISHADRTAVEEGLKSGLIRIVVATSSLDLGVDFPEVERVYQVGSPKGLARLVQRAGRSSHRPLADCTITGVPSNAWEIVEYAAARQGLLHGDLEPQLPPRGGLDVLIQHLVTAALGGGFTTAGIGREVRSAAAYRDLTPEALAWCLTFVTTGGNVLSAYPAYRRVELDGESYVLKDRRQAALHRMNIGTIVGGEQAVVKLQRGKPLGRIDEGYAARLKPGDRFVFAGRTLELIKLQDLTAYVRVAAGKSPNVPAWQGEIMPLSAPLGREVRALLADAKRREPAASEPEVIAAEPLFVEQARRSNVPDVDELLLETWTGRDGRYLFIYPFAGRVVHESLAALLALRLSRLVKATFATTANDYGFALATSTDVDFERLLTPDLCSAERLDQDLLDTVNAGEIAKRHFREIARIAGLVRQTHYGQKRSGSAVHVSAALLFSTLDRFDPGHLLVEEARRAAAEAMGSRGGLARTLAQCSSDNWLWTRLDRPSPLAFPLVVERIRARVGSESLEEQVARMIAGWTQTGRSDAGPDVDAGRRSGRLRARTSGALAPPEHDRRRRSALGQKRSAATRRPAAALDAAD